MPKETLKYLILLKKSEKEFKIINLYCNSDFTIISQYFKILLECLPRLLFTRNVTYKLYD